MPTVRGLIQEVQHQGLLHKGKLALLEGASIGIDAIQFFDALYHPAPSYEMLGAVDHEGLQAVVEQQLQNFKRFNITPIFVFPGLSPSDRVYNIDQQHDTLIQQYEQYQKEMKELQEEQQNVLQQQQSQQFEDIMGGFSMYRTTSNKKANKAKLQNIANQSVANATTSKKLTKFTPPVATLDEVNWRFDEESLSNRQHGWDSIQSKNYDTAQQHLTAMSTGFLGSYRKALFQILKTFADNKTYGSISLLHAPYTVSAQLAWLQRQPHRFVHAVLGSSDLLLFGVEKFIQTIHFDSETFNFVLFDEVLTKFNVNLTQLIEASLLSGYSYALTHPLALNDLKSHNQFHFSTALNNIVKHGGLQKTLEWYITQPQCFAFTPTNPTTNSLTSTILTSADSANVGGKKGKDKEQNDLIEEHVKMMESIQKVMIQFQGSAALGPQGKLVLLRTTAVDTLDLATVRKLGKEAYKIYKIQEQQKQQLQQKIALAGKKGAAQFAEQQKQQLQTVTASATTTTTDDKKATDIDADKKKKEDDNNNKETKPLQQVTIRPHIPLPKQIVNLLTTATIQPASLSSILTGHVLDLTTTNPSLELDQLLDFSNLIIRGPAIWSLLYSFYKNSQNVESTGVDAAYGKLYQQTKFQPPFYTPFILNSRFNDKRRGVWPRDIFQYLRAGGSESSLTFGTDKIAIFEEKDQLFSPQQYAAFYGIVQKIAYDETTQISPISHYLALLPEVNRLAPPVVVQTSTVGKKKAKKGGAVATVTQPEQQQQQAATPSEQQQQQQDNNNTKLDITQQCVAMTMMYALYFMGYITANGNITPFGATLVPILQPYLNKTNNSTILDTLLILHVLLQSESFHTKLLTIQSSEVQSNNLVLAGKGETTYKQQTQRLLCRILSLLNDNIQIEAMGKDNYNNLLAMEEKPTATTTSATNNNKNANNTKLQLNNTYLSILSREFACYSTMANTFVTTMQYSYDLLLIANVLFFSNNQYVPKSQDNNNKVNFAALYKYTPLQTFQATPLLACAVRNQLLTNGKTNNNNNNTNIDLTIATKNIPQDLINTITTFWSTLEKNVGLGVSSDDVKNAFAYVQKE